jgi:hypothetical protein
MLLLSLVLVPQLALHLVVVSAAGSRATEPVLSGVTARGTGASRRSAWATGPLWLLGPASSSKPRADFGMLLFIILTFSEIHFPI